MIKKRKRVREYVRVAEVLRNAILEGKLLPGQKMTAERLLCDQLNTSRITIRHALRTLEDERLIVRRQGSGTYVATRPSRRIPLRIDYTGSMRDHAPSLERELLLWRWQPASGVASEVLQIGESAEVFYTERIDSLKKEPVAWDQVYIPRRFAEELVEGYLSQVDFIETWSDVCGFEIGSCKQTIDAVAASAEVAKHLSVKRGTPVLKATEVYITVEGRHAGLYITHYHPDRVCIASQQQWTGKGSET